MGTTRVQRRIFGGLQKARRKIAALSSGGPPERKLVAETLEVSEKDLKETVHRMQARDVSIDAPVANEDGAPLSDSLADDVPDAEANLVNKDLRRAVREKLDDVYDDLSSRERYLLNHRLLSDTPITLEATGKQFGVTRERVRQIEERLKGKLREHLMSAQLS